MNKSAYKRREREIGVAIEDIAANSCAMVLENEIEIEKASGTVLDKDARRLVLKKTVFLRGRVR